MTLNGVRRIAIVSVVLMQACAAGGTVEKAPSREKGAMSGREGQIDFWYAVNPDCTSEGYPDVLVLARPMHGALRVARGENFPQFAANNVRHVCNTRKVPVTLLYYQSAQGFTGADTAVVEILFPSGNVRIVTYSINVRP